MPIAYKSNGEAAKQAAPQKSNTQNGSLSLFVNSYQVLSLYEKKVAKINRLQFRPPCLERKQE
jgi:hypothetical protein